MSCPPLSRILPVAGIVLVTSLLLSGCSAAGEQSSEPLGSTTESQPEPDSDAAAPDSQSGTATVSIDGRDFTFQLSRCLIYDESEVELAGPGSENGSSLASYFDGGVMQLGTDALGEFRIDIGADGPFQSSDEFLAVGAPTGGGDFSVIKAGNGYLATGKSWDNTGADLGTGTVQFSCA